MSAQEEHLSSSDYSRLCALIYKRAGIQLGAERKTMLSARINRRLRSLDLASYSDYCSYLFGIQGQKEEIPHLIDVVTTNKTDFFREPAHFDYLMQKALPILANENGSGRPLLIWSAGCSTGEEPYTLTMLLSEYTEAHPGFRFRILATDVSHSVLAKAATGVYSTQLVEPIPFNLRQKYLMRSRIRTSTEVRIVPELRRLVEFRHLNFMDDDYGILDPVDAIFCRNVIIYFDRPTKQAILSKLLKRLVPNGFLFVGHAESLHDLDLPIRPVAPALYRKVDGHG